MTGMNSEGVAERSVAPSFVFFGARWCDPTVPMRTIFDELMREFHRCGLGVRGVVADIDEVESVLRDLSDEAEAGRPRAESSLDAVLTAKLIESIDYLPMIVLVGEDGEIARFAGMQPKLRIRDAVFGALGVNFGA